MYGRLVFYFETSPLKRRLYFSVWCTFLSQVRQEMSIRIEDEKDRQGAKCQRGVQNAVYNISRSPAPKPALVPASRLYFDIDICSMKFCRKSH